MRPGQHLILYVPVFPLGFSEYLDWAKEGDGGVCINIISKSFECMFIFEIS
jgi:hypothetical protein